MHQLFATMMILTTLTWATPALASSSLPEPTSRRVILHGVDCSIDNATVCTNDRPVFDEAIAGVPDTGVAVIQAHVLEALGGGPANRLPGGGAEAVREYFVDGGLNPEQVGIEGCTEPPVLLDWIQPVEVQLSRSFQ